MTGTAIAPKPKPALAAPDYLDKRFLEAFSGRLGQLTPDQQTAFLMALGERIGVRAELGEVIIYFDKPYVNYDGRVRQAHKTGLLQGMDARPATSLERRDYGCADNVRLWTAKVYRRGAAHAFQGWGEAGGPTDNNPVSKTKPAQMAKKRARYDGLRSAFPIGEDITQMHQEMIEDAEREAVAIRDKSGNTAVIAAAYDDEAEDSIDDRTDEVAVAEPSTPGARAITEAQTARILALADRKELIGMKETIEAKLKAGGFNEATAEGYIAVLETTIAGPPAAVSSAELALGDVRKSAPSPQAAGH